MHQKQSGGTTEVQLILLFQNVHVCRLLLLEFWISVLVIDLAKIPPPHCAVHRKEEAN